MTVAYVESSALVKLVVAEPESRALRAGLAGATHRVASDLAMVETARAARRAAGDRGLARARALFLRLAFVPIDREVVERAVALDPPALRSLDAIHVATACSLGAADLVFFSYDERTAGAARAAGLRVEAPG